MNVHSAASAKYVTYFNTLSPKGWVLNGLGGRALLCFIFRLSSPHFLHSWLLRAAFSSLLTSWGFLPLASALLGPHFLYSCLLGLPAKYHAPAPLPLSPYPCPCAMPCPVLPAPLPPPPPPPLPLPRFSPSPCTWPPAAFPAASFHSVSPPASSSSWPTRGASEAKNQNMEPSFSFANSVPDAL